VALAVACSLAFALWGVLVSVQGPALTDIVASVLSTASGGDGGDDDDADAMKMGGGERGVVLFSFFLTRGLGGIAGSFLGFWSLSHCGLRQGTQRWSVGGLFFNFRGYQIALALSLAVIPFLTSCWFLVGIFAVSVLLGASVTFGYAYAAWGFVEDPRPVSGWMNVAFAVGGAVAPPFVEAIHDHGGSRLLGYAAAAPIAGACVYALTLTSMPKEPAVKGDATIAPSNTDANELSRSAFRKLWWSVLPITFLINAGSMGAWGAFMAYITLWASETSTEYGVSRAEANYAVSLLFILDGVCRYAMLQCPGVDARVGIVVGGGMLLTAMLPLLYAPSSESLWASAALLGVSMPIFDTHILFYIQDIGLMDSAASSLISASCQITYVVHTVTALFTACDGCEMRLFKILGGINMVCVALSALMLALGEIGRHECATAVDSDKSEHALYSSSVTFQTESPLPNRRPPRQLQRPHPAPP